MQHNYTRHFTALQYKFLFAWGLHPFSLACTKLDIWSQAGHHLTFVPR